MYIEEYTTYQESEVLAFIIIIAALLLPFQAQDFSPRLPGCLLCRLGRLAPQYFG